MKLREVPAMLKGYKFYENDKKFCKRFMFLVEEWNRTFPEVNIKNELAWAHNWLLTNGKQYKDMGRYFGSWVARTHRDALGKTTVKVQKLPPPPKYEETEDVMTGDDFKAMRESLRKK